MREPLDEVADFIHRAEDSPAKEVARDALRKVQLANRSAISRVRAGLLEIAHGRGWDVGEQTVAQWEDTVEAFMDPQRMVVTMALDADTGDQLRDLAASIDDAMIRAGKRLLAEPDAEPCEEHSWVNGDSENGVVTGLDVCSECGAMRARPPADL